MSILLPLITSPPPVDISLLIWYDWWVVFHRLPLSGGIDLTCTSEREGTFSGRTGFVRVQEFGRCEVAFMKFYLIVAKGKNKGMPIPISVDLFMIGSGTECQLRCKLPTMPAEHCALVTRERKVFVRDFDSGEPTLVNGSLVPPGQEWPLHAGDLLKID